MRTCEVKSSLRLVPFSVVLMIPTYLEMGWETMGLKAIQFEHLIKTESQSDIRVNGKSSHFIEEAGWPKQS
jgi:hypothetical protein